MLIYPSSATLNDAWKEVVSVPGDDYILLLQILINLWANHRVDRVLSFFSSRRNWDSPTPSTSGECDPPPLVRGGGTHSLAGERVGWSQFRRGDLYCGKISVKSCVLCNYWNFGKKSYGVILALFANFNGICSKNLCQVFLKDKTILWVH